MAGRQGLQLPEVDGDVHGHASHALVEGPGRGMEGVSSSSPDGDHLDVFSGHVVEGVLAQGRAQVVAPVCRRCSEDDDVAVAPGWVDPPGDVPGDRSITGLGDGHVLVGCWVVKRGDLGAVVIGPLAVLVMEDHLSDQWPEVVLVKRAERIDRQVGQSIQIIWMV
jgi:hypothetical protein